MASTGSIARLGGLVSCSIRAAAQPLLHGIQLAAAVSLALFVAFYLQLDTPSWAGTTAAIVCQPVVGSAILKGAFRLVGTAVGAVAAVTLTAIFPQDRAGFLFGMVVWVTACSFVSTLLRNFAAYAAMLSGYTLVIIAGTSVSAPDQVFEIAISRASEICVGIVSATLVVGLTDLGDAPERLSALLSGLIAETTAHLSSTLSTSKFAGTEGQTVRRALIARVAALDPIIDQAAGESPELLQRRSVLRAAAHGLFEALSGVRIVETHLRYLPEDEAFRKAGVISAELSAGPTMLDREDNLAIVRKMVGLRTDDPSLRLIADGTADAALGLAAAANGLALLQDPGRARDIQSVGGGVVADYLPALINALRAFVGVSTMIVVWIATAWPNGPQAVIFTAVVILVFSPMSDRSIKLALGQSIGTSISVPLVAIVKFALLVNKETFLAFALVISIAIVPLAALSSVPILAPYFIPATFNFIPLLAPTNEMTFDTLSYVNTALGLLTGCAAGGLALLLIPHLPPGLQSQRLVDLSIRDVRRLAAGRKSWALHEWQGRIFARMIAMPETAEPIQRSYLVTTLTVGIQLIRLGRIAARGPIGADLWKMRESLAAGDIDALRGALRRLDEDMAAVSNSVPGARGRVRARAALLAIGDAARSHREYFEGRLS
jgi:uncharacterized membrane protein YccC